LVKIGSNISNSSGTISLTKANVTAALGYTPPTSDTNTVTLNGTSQAASTTFYAPTSLSGETYFLAGGTSAPAWKPRNQVTSNFYNMTGDKYFTYVKDSTDSQFYIRAGDGQTKDVSQTVNIGGGSVPIDTVYAREIKNAYTSGTVGTNRNSSAVGSITLTNSGNSIIYNVASNVSYFRPTDDNTQCLGGTNFRWKTVYGSGGNFSGNMTVGGTLGVTGITTIEARIQPKTDNTIQLGTGSLRFTNVYCMKSAMNTSDLNAKRNLTKIDDRYIELFDLIEPYAFHFTTGDRVHTGFISQYVEEAMKQVGLTAKELGFFCKDIKCEYFYDDDGNYIGEKEVYDEDGNPVYVYSLRYTEYIAIMAEKIKRLERKYNSKLEELEKRLEALEA
jgi:hypothetical protein